MWKWLRSWFAWRFRLTRLVVAVVFLGAFVGLNLMKQEVHLEEGLTYDMWGWPMPVAWAVYDTPAHVPTRLLSADDFDQREWLAWTHQAYHLAYSIYDWDYDWAKKLDTRIPLKGDGEIFCTWTAVNLLLASGLLTLILFFHPRRKPEPEGAK